MLYSHGKTAEHCPLTLKPPAIRGGSRTRRLGKPPSEITSRALAIDGSHSKMAGSWASRRAKSPRVFGHLMWDSRKCSRGYGEPCPYIWAPGTTAVFHRS